MPPCCHYLEKCTIPMDFRALGEKTLYQLAKMIISPSTHLGINKEEEVHFTLFYVTISGGLETKLYLKMKCIEKQFFMVGYNTIKQSKCILIAGCNATIAKTNTKIKVITIKKVAEPTILSKWREPRPTQQTNTIILKQKHNLLI